MVTASGEKKKKAKPFQDKFSFVILFLKKFQINFHLLMECRKSSSEENTFKFTSNV